MHYVVVSARNCMTAIGLLILAMALWASAFVAMKQALAIASIADVMFYRLALARLVMLPVVLARAQR